jgi:hypothetical protein
MRHHGETQYKKIFWQISLACRSSPLIQINGAFCSLRKHHVDLRRRGVEQPTGALKWGNRKGQAMSIKTTKNAIALGAAGMLGAAGALVIATASPSLAIPVWSNMAAVGTAAANQVIDVRHYRRGYYGRRTYRRGYYRRGYYDGGAALAAGLALGMLGAAAAAPYYGPYYYGPPVYYVPYGYGYGPNWGW